MSGVVTVWVVCGNVCCVVVVVKDSVLALECRSMLYICARDEMYGKCEYIVIQMFVFIMW